MVLLLVFLGVGLVRIRSEIEERGGGGEKEEVRGKIGEKEDRRGEVGGGQRGEYKRGKEKKKREKVSARSQKNDLIKRRKREGKTDLIHLYP